MNADEILRAASATSAAQAISLWRALMQVLLRELEGLAVPDEVLPALNEARRHWATERSDPRKLEEGKAMCWNYLGRFPAGESLSSKDGRRVRALLCVLEPDGDQESASMTADWFADMTAGTP